MRSMFYQTFLIAASFSFNLTAVENRVAKNISNKNILSKYFKFRLTKILNISSEKNIMCIE
jgi:hypothetical protein